MDNFTEDLIIGDDSRCWGDENGLLYFFNTDGTGSIVVNEEHFDLAWKINDKGLLILKDSFHNVPHIFKIIHEEEQRFICKKFKKHNDDLSLISEIEFTYISYEEDINEINENAIIKIRNEIKSYTNNQKIYFIFSTLLISLFIYFIQNMIPILDKTPIWMKLTITIAFMVFTLDKIYLTLKVLLKIITNKSIS
jgi:hypothetical protein